MNIISFWAVSSIIPFLSKVCYNEYMTSVSSTGDSAMASQTSGTTVMSAEQLAQSIKDVARRIREESAKMRDTVKVINQSGAIIELTNSVRDATIAARDTSKEISQTARDLKDRGVIKDAAIAFDDSVRNAKETAQTVSTLSEEVRQKVPETETFAKALESAKEPAVVAAEKTKEAVKEKAEKAKAKLKKG